jgi:hypothetical protein
MVAGTHLSCRTVTSGRRRASLIGRWRIEETDVWDRNALDLVGPAFIEFGRDNTGSFGFIAVRGWMDCRQSVIDECPAVEFTWDGNDECRITSEEDLFRRALSPHLRRMAEVAWTLGADERFAHLHLRRHAHSLGYGGHFLSNSRRYSTSFGALKANRVAWRSQQRHGVATADHSVEARWRAVGIGWAVRARPCSQGSSNDSGQWKSDWPTRSGTGGIDGSTTVRIGAEASLGKVAGQLLASRDTPHSGDHPDDEGRRQRLPGCGRDPDPPG